MDYSFLSGFAGLIPDYSNLSALRQVSPLPSLMIGIILEGQTIFLSHYF